MSIRSNRNDIDEVMYMGLNKSASVREKTVFGKISLDAELKDSKQESLPDEASGAESKEALGGAGKKTIVNEDYTEAANNSGCLPMAMGAGIIMAFLDLIEYCNKIAQQQNELSQTMARAIMGGSITETSSTTTITKDRNAKDGQTESTDQNGDTTVVTAKDGIVTTTTNTKTTIELKQGLAKMWIDTAIQAGQDQADGLKSQAIGYIVGAAVAGASLLGMTGGFMKNCTTTFNNERKALSEQLEGLQNYKKGLLGGQKAEIEAQASKERVDIEMVEIQPNQQAAGSSSVDRRVELDNETQARVEQLEKGVGIQGYRGKTFNNRTAEQKQADELMDTAMGHLSRKQNTQAMKSAEKKIKETQNQLSAGDTKQNNWTQFTSAFSQAGSAAGQAYGGWENSEAQAKAAASKANADALQQVVSGTENVKGKAAQNLDAQLDAMKQDLSQMASVLTAINQRA